MRTILLFILGIVISLNSWSQTVVMGEPGFPEDSPMDCNNFGIVGTNFQDPGAGGNYPPNFNDTSVFCPDLNLGTKATITFAINAGFEFNVDGSDFIQVFDGPDATAPLLGIHNSVTDPGGFTYQASWNNPSGCLTVVFITDGSGEGTGWEANASCGNQFQPFEAHMEAYINGTGPDAINPTDTGFVDICFGDSILFIAKPIFPNSLDSTGFGYSQNINTDIDFEWNITDGNVYPNNDSIWFTPPARSGYLVDLKIEDQFPLNERVRSKVRVSLLPSFAGTGPLQDSVCLGASTTLVGGVTPQDTVGVTIPPGTFELGGNFAGLTYLPDGSGQQYEAPITINGFPGGSTITDDQDLNQVCITMEHSYLGDLEIWLQCPNGTIVPLVNSFTGGFLPGGNSGGGTYMGDPIDDSGGGGPGEGWEYCFSSVFNDINGSITDNLGNTIPAPNFGNNGPSIDPNVVYQPEDSFNSLIGCPVNGNWTIFVQDNIGIDDGYIFEWGLFFDASYFPGLGSYQTSADTSWWTEDPTIISGMNDTLIEVQPDAVGTYSYTFNVTDDFGCPFDTTVSFTVTEGPEIFPDTIACDLAFQVSETISFSGGEWSTLDTAITFSDILNNNPLITSSSGGYFDVFYTDNECNVTTEAQIHFPPFLYIEMPDTSVCAGTNYELVPIVTANDLDSGYVPTLIYEWGNGSTDSTLVLNNAGTYVFTVSNECVDVTENFTILPNASIPNDTTVCDYAFQLNGTIAPNGGFWSSPDTEISIDGDVLSPDVETSIAGIYELTFTDSTCASNQSMIVSFPPNYSVIAMDTNVCIGSTVSLNALGIPDPIQAGYPIDYSLFWSNGEE
jgi:subtilisin-like proprotein convertase family protein